jgi:HEAT repeat protein/ATP/ADP translocase
VTRPGAALAALLDAALHIRPGEGRRTALLFSHLLLASAVFILGRTVRDTLFLSRYPIRYLPWMFVLYGVASAVTVVVYARYADRVARHRLIVGSTAIGIATYLATWALVRARAAWVYPAFYVWSEVVANLFIVQFWTLANDLHDARAAKRLFGTIGAARVLGVVVVGLGAGAAVKAIGTEQLLFVLAGLMAGIAVLALLVSREARAESGVRAGARPRRRGTPPGITRDPYVRVLAVVILVAFVALTIGDYQFKRIARATFQEDDLARFFSLFYAGTGLVSFVFQLLLTPRILARLGVGAGMAVMPTVFGAASGVLLALPKLAVATVMKFSDNGFQYTIHETTLQALYVPFAPEVKARTRAFLDAVIKPLSYGVGGLALVIAVPLLDGRGMGVHTLSALTVPLTLIWLTMIPVVRRRYLRTLEATLSARGALALDHEYLLDSAGRSVLVRTLERGTPRQVLIALEQLGTERDPQVLRAVERLAEHPEPLVRTAALYHLAHTGVGDAGCARNDLADPQPEVRAAAAAAYGALAQDEAVDALAPLLGDPDPDVRVASLAGLLKHGGVEGGIVGGAELGRLLQSGRESDLVSAARALRHLGPGAYRPLKRLLEDRDPVVRRAALKAAPGVADPRLVPTLVALLSDPPCRRRAGQALVAVGEAAVEPLVRLVGDGATPRAVQLEVPRLLRRIPTERSYALLRGQLNTPDSHLRLRILAALSRLRRDLRRHPEPLPFVQALVVAEIAESYGNQAGWDRAKPLYQTPLLDEVFAFRQQRAVRRVLRALELRYDPEPLALVRETLADAKRRANALEVLDTVLDAPLRPLVMPFVDEAPLKDKLSRAGPLVPPQPPPEQFMAGHCRHPNPYVALLALDALARRQDAAGATQGAALLAHPDPLVREGAIRALAAADPSRAPALVAETARDPDATVARHARLALARLTGQPAPEEPMYSTVEKILFLKSAPVFERVSGEDLAPLARVAEVELYSPGEVLTREGEVGDALYVIVRGKVAISRQGTPLATLGSGEAVGEMAVLDSEPRSATATALEETEVLVIGSEEFYEVLHEQVEIAEGIIRLLSARLRDADAEIGRLREAASG